MPIELFKFEIKDGISLQTTTGRGCTYMTSGAVWNSIFEITLIHLCDNFYFTQSEKI